MLKGGRIVSDIRSTEILGSVTSELVTRGGPCVYETRNESCTKKLGETGRLVI
jgi:hypothetical protein